MASLVPPHFSLVLFLALGLPAAAQEVTVSAAQAKNLGIETRAPESAALGSASRLPATVVVPPQQLRVVAAPLAGLVAQVAVAAGDTVRAGQVLARLESPQLLELQRNDSVARSQAELARRSEARDEALYAEGIIAESRLAASRASAREAQALARQSGGALGLAGGDGTLRAPIAGTVLEQNAVPGQRVEAATPLFRIGRLAPLWLEIQVPASLAPRLKPGLAVTVEEGGARGVVVNVGRQLGGGQTLTLRARVEQGAESLRPGQAVEVRLAVPAAGAAVALWRLPASALVRLPEPHVFVATAKGYAALPVKVETDGGDFLLLSAPSLRADSAVAVKGVASLKAAWSAGVAPGGKE